jgi:hypothetical protein
MKVIEMDPVRILSTHEKSKLASAFIDSMGPNLYANVEVTDDWAAGMFQRINNSIVCNTSRSYVTAFATAAAFELSLLRDDDRDMIKTGVSNVLPKLRHISTRKAEDAIARTMFWLSNYNPLEKNGDYKPGAIDYYYNTLAAAAFICYCHRSKP